MQELPKIFTKKNTINETAIRLSAKNNKNTKRTFAGHDYNS
jgi:hypothetical protein